MRRDRPFLRLGVFLEQYVTAEHDGFTVSSSSETEAEVRQGLGIEAVEAKEEQKTTATPEEPGAEPSENAGQERNPDGTFKAKDAKAEDKPKEEKPVKPAVPRIKELTFEREQARQEAALWRERAERAERLAAERAVAKPEPAKTSATGLAKSAEEGDPEPQEGEFEDYRAYVKAQARWEARQEFKEQTRRAQEHQQHARREHVHSERANKFNERFRAAAEADPEFLSSLSLEVLDLRPSTALQPGERPTGSTAVADIVMDAEKPDILLRYFSANPQDLRRIAALHPMLAVREMGRLEERLAGAAPNTGSAPKAPAISQARPPVRPVQGSHSVSDDPPGDEADFDSHMRYWNAKERQARR